MTTKDQLWLHETPEAPKMILESLPRKAFEAGYGALATPKPAQKGPGCGHLSCCENLCRFGRFELLQSETKPSAAFMMVGLAPSTPAVHSN